jgi:hypothetical protein
MIVELEERSQRPVRWMLQVSNSLPWDAWARTGDGGSRGKY